MSHYDVIAGLAFALLTIWIYKRSGSNKSRSRAKRTYGLGRGLSDEAAMAVEDIAGEFLGAPVNPQAGVRRAPTIIGVSDSGAKHAET